MINGLTTEEVRWRWIVSLHESAHSLCNFAYSGEPASAAIRPLGGGDASLHQLPSAAYAIAIAAGKAAEALSQQVAAPALSVGEAMIVDVRRHLAQRDEAERPHNLPRLPVICDEVWLARWAIDGHEDFPERWAGRVAWAKAQAQAFVADNAGAIVALANRLYQRGTITPADFTALGLTTEPAHPAPAAAAAEAAKQPVEPAKDHKCSQV